MKSLDNKFTFNGLVESIRLMNKEMAARAGKAVNICLTMRNWAIGYYIVEYEQNGTDRAEYGEKLLQRLSDELRISGAAKYHPRELRRCRTFYSVYPHIGGTVFPEFKKLLPAIPDFENEKRGTVSPELTTPTIGG